VRSNTSEPTSAPLHFLDVNVTSSVRNYIILDRKSAIILEVGLPKVKTLILFSYCKSSFLLKCWRENQKHPASKAQTGNVWVFSIYLL